MCFAGSPLSEHCGPLTEEKKLEPNLASFGDFWNETTQKYSPAVVAWFAKASISLSVDSALSANGGLIPSQDYDIDHSEVEILCHYSKSRAPSVKA